MPRVRVPLALYDILDASEDFLSFIGALDTEALRRDRLRRLAVERCVEIISEASRRVPQEWKSEHPHIPWSDIAGIGSVLRHSYEDVNLETIVQLRGPLLDELRKVVTALLDKYDPDGVPYRKRDPDP